jgi:dipeptidase E
MDRQLLLLSNSTNYGKEWLEHAEKDIQKFLGEDIQDVLFIPYAGVTITFDEYTERARKKFGELGYGINSVHETDDPVTAVRDAEAIAVGGGNTFHLVYNLHKYGLIQPIRDKLDAGIPYIGWSAGSNVACPSLMTTNDMPIIQPESFETLNLVPFQINPHYLDANPEGHKGETREERIEEFITVNQDVRVLGLREGSTLRIHGETMRLLGHAPVRVFRHGEQPVEYKPQQRLDFLLKREE